MADINGRFVKPLIALYGELGTDDMDLVIDLYVKTLAGYADDVLEAGFKHLAGTYMPSKRNPWPAPALCKKACDKALHERKAAAPREPEKPRYPEWSSEAVRTADELINADVGRRAAREGWVLGLHDFCRHNRRLPLPHEIQKIVETSQYIVHCAAGGVRMGACHGALQTLADSMLAKRERLARKVLGEAA